MSLLEQAWNESYARRENFIFQPNEHVVRFLSRYVRRRTGLDRFEEVLLRDAGDAAATLRALDFGCGLGRGTQLLDEFGLDATGVDISAEAIEAARSFARSAGKPQLAERFHVLDSAALPFGDDRFDISVAANVLDSMTFAQARAAVLELERVTTRLLYIDLISIDSSRQPPGFAGEETVATAHERGTIQSYFDWDKVLALFADTRLVIRSGYETTERWLTSDLTRRRYHLALVRT